MSLYQTRVIDSRHPNFMSNVTDWEKWRLTYRGGEEFRNKYLERFTTREDVPDFEARKRLTPVPAFAKAAINRIRNSIFQRMHDITRRGGSPNYQRAIAGLDQGVDRRGSTMNAFLGIKCLTELLTMGRTGVFVDNSVIAGETLADVGNARPYLYAYQVEDILSWACTKPDEPSEFQSVLLRDTVMDYDMATMLPLQQFQRLRLLWVNQDTGLVNLQFYSADGDPIDRAGNPSGPIELELTRIPFIMLDLGDSLLKDICNHQIALLNLLSSDVNFALKANFPFYIEQRDLRAVGSHLKQAANPDGTATAGGQAAHDNEITMGATRGRAYDIKASPPAFINPSSDPLKASMDLREEIAQEINRLVNLGVETLVGKMPTGTQALDSGGLEAGLSYIGLVLESAERKIAECWAAYEDRVVSRRKIATIKYPDRYSLKTDQDRIDEATSLSKLMSSVPGQTVKREISKSITQALLGGKINVDTITKINSEIDESSYTTSDPATILQAVEAGLCGEKTGSMALGFSETEHIQAKKDHAERAARVAQAQASVKGSNNSGGDPAARGVPDLSANPNAPRQEKQQGRDRTLHDSKRRRVRGQGANNQGDQT
ncbi:MAG: hypothetical protein ACYC35_00530 [Pirellulales bacterium]|jgi:hypothetical protein